MFENEQVLGALRLTVPQYSEVALVTTCRNSILNKCAGDSPLRVIWCCQSQSTQGKVQPFYKYKGMRDDSTVPRVTEIMNLVALIAPSLLQITQGQI